MPERDPSSHQTFAGSGLVSFGMTGWLYIWVETSVMPSASEASLYIMQNLSKNVVTSSASEVSYHTIHKSIENVFISNELES